MSPNDNEPAVSLRIRQPTMADYVRQDTRRPHPLPSNRFNPQTTTDSRVHAVNYSSAKRLVTDKDEKVSACLHLDGMSSATQPARSKRKSAAIDYLALTCIKGLGDKGIAHVLAQVGRDAGTIAEFFRCSPRCLRERYGLRSSVADNLASQVEQAGEKAVAIFQRACDLGIVILAPGDAEYPARVREFYDDTPPLLYAFGNVSLLDSACVALVNSAKPVAHALESTLALASRLAEAGQTLVVGTESSSYNVVSLAAKRADGCTIYVMHHGLFAAVKPGPQCEPAPLTRCLGEPLAPDRSLLVSPFRLDGRWQKGNGPRRDQLVMALAKRIVAVDVKAGGTIEELCREAIRIGRRVFACQIVERTKAARANESLLAGGAAALVADPAGSNVDIVLDAQRPAETLFPTDDLERRRSLGQFFTPPEVAQFMWNMVEVLRGKKWKAAARVIDPACGEGVFLKVAAERGHAAKNCFGVDIDETLVPLWQDDERLRGARLFRASGLLDNPSIGLVPGSFDLVIGNPPFSGQGLKDLLQLTQSPASSSTQRQRSLFGDEPDESFAKDADANVHMIGRHQRAILDYLARQLSRYACWRLRDGLDDGANESLAETLNGGGLFADLDLDSERPIRASDYERMARAVADWPVDRPLDTSQPEVRDTIRRLASTAIEVFFTERFVQLAKPGGMIAVIVPESILASDQLAPLRLWLMRQIQLLAVVSLPQKVFTGVGAKAKTGIVFARRYTAAELEAHAKAPGRIAEELRDKKILLTSPHPDADDWSFDDYLLGVTESAKRVADANI